MKKSIVNSMQITQNRVSNLNRFSLNTNFKQTPFCGFHNPISTWKYHQNNRQDKLYNFNETNRLELEVEDDLPP